MKDKIQANIQTFSRAIIQPIMFMAVTGILLSVSAILKMQGFSDLLEIIGEGINTVLASGIISNLSIIFCIGIGTAIAKKKKTDAAVLSISTFLIFLYANNFWLSITNRLAEEGTQGLFGTGQAEVLGVQVTDMGVLLGIVLGCLVGYFVNKFGGVKFNKYLSPYEGTRFVYLILIFLVIVLAIAVTYIWPPINNFISFLTKLMVTSGPIGLFFSQFLNKMLLPFGMHHLLWVPLQFSPLGGTATIGENTYSGAMNIWLAELGNTSSLSSIHWSVGLLVQFGFIALPIGIALALIKTSKPENKDKVKGLVIPLVATAMLAGITEPIEFSFLFVAPILWLAHATILGLGTVVGHFLGLHTAVNTLPETIMWSIAIPSHLGRQWLIIPIAIGSIALEYYVFKYLILKFDLPTLGREQIEEQEISNENNSNTTYDKNFDILIEGLGGLENIQEIDNCYSRLRINIIDEEKVNIDKVKEYPSSGVIQNGKNIQVVIGTNVQEVKENFDNYIYQETF